MAVKKKVIKRKPTKSKVASKVSTKTKVSLVVAMALAAFIGHSFALSMLGSIGGNSSVKDISSKEIIVDDNNNNCEVNPGGAPCNPPCSGDEICVVYYGNNGQSDSRCVDLFALIDAFIKTDSLRTLSDENSGGQEITDLEDTVNGEEWNRCHVDMNNSHTLYCRSYRYSSDSWDSASYDCGGTWVNDGDGNWSCP